MDYNIIEMIRVLFHDVVIPYRGVIPHLLLFPKLR